MDQDDRNRGLYNKFSVVQRADGSDSPGGKHHRCEYFVLDLTHDPYAGPALAAYAASCEADYPTLARDLRVKAAALTGRPSLAREDAEALLADFKAKDFQRVGLCGYVLNDRAADLIERLLREAR